MKQLAAALAAIVALAACGSSTGVASDPPAEPSTSPTVDQAAIDAAEAARAAAKCRQQVGPIMQELQGIDSRLDIGLTQPDFNTALGDASVAYDQIPIARLDPDCLSWVAVPLEYAFNEYIRANDDWSACIDDYYCDLELDALPGLRDQWTAAAGKIAKAERGLERIGRPGPAV